MLYSVIVPIYKVEPYLKKCVDSILNQTYKNFELLLIDDGSPDNCPKICDEYAAKDSRVRVIHKPNGGLVSARNTGVKEALGEYICYVDGDDWVSEKLLKTIKDKAIDQYHPNMVVFSANRVFSNHTTDIYSGPKEGLYNKEKLQNEIYPYMMYDCRKSFCSGLVFPVAWNKIYKRDLLQQHYCEEERIKMGEDNAFVFECLFYSDSVYFCDDVLYYYNQQNIGSFIHSYDPNRFGNNILLTSYIDKKLGGKNAVLDSQINAFKAYWLIMAIFHEVKSGKKINKAYKHISRNLKDGKITKDISLNGLPKSAQVYVLMIKLRMYRLVLLGAKIVSSFRG